MLSGHVHSGLVGVAGVDREVYHLIVSDALRLIRDCTIDAFSNLGSELRLSAAVPDWAETLEFLPRVQGLSLVDLRLQALGEPQRLQYLEEHELSVV